MQVSAVSNGNYNDKLNFKGVVCKNPHIQTFMRDAEISDLHKFKEILLRINNVPDNRVFIMRTAACMNTKWSYKPYKTFYELHSKHINDGSIVPKKLIRFEEKESTRTKKLSIITEALKNFYTDKIKLENKTGQTEGSKDDLIREINTLLVDSVWGKLTNL